MIEIVGNAHFLGKGLQSSACVYLEGGGTIFLTGSDLTDYLQFVTKLTFLHITDFELSLISTHLIRVTAAISPSEADKDATYIKLRLRWLNDCFLVYLRNIDMIMIQHNKALGPTYQHMIELAISHANLPDVTGEQVVDLTIPDLEDED